MWSYFIVKHIIRKLIIKIKQRHIFCFIKNVETLFLLHSTLTVNIYNNLKSILFLLLVIFVVGILVLKYRMNHIYQYKVFSFFGTGIIYWLFVKFKLYNIWMLSKKKKIKKLIFYCASTLVTPLWAGAFSAYPAYLLRRFCIYATIKRWENNDKRVWTKIMDVRPFGEKNSEWR